MSGHRDQIINPSDKFKKLILRSNKVSKKGKEGTNFILTKLGHRIDVRPNYLYFQPECLEDFKEQESIIIESPQLHQELPHSRIEDIESFLDGSMFVLTKDGEIYALFSKKMAKKLVLGVK